MQVEINIKGFQIGFYLFYRYFQYFRIIFIRIAYDISFKGNYGVVGIGKYNYKWGK